MKVSWPTMSADDAAEIIQHNDMVAFSGFTPPVRPKRCLPRSPDAPMRCTRYGSLFRFDC